MNSWLLPQDILHTVVAANGELSGANESSFAASFKVDAKALRLPFDLFSREEITDQTKNNYWKKMSFLLHLHILI